MADTSDPIVEFREDHRKVLSKWYAQQKQGELGKYFAQSRAEGVPLLRHANTIRKGQY